MNNSGKGQGSGLGIASIVLSCIWYLSVPAGIVSVILGIVQMVKNEKKGMAIAGIICSVIGIILAIIMIVSAVAFLNSDAYTSLLNSTY